MITNGGAIRLSVPLDWVCAFEGTVVVGGVAAAKVGAPAYTDGGRTLLLPVLADFADSDEITIAGLRLAGLRLVVPGSRSLELDFDGDGQRDKYDDYTLVVLPQ